MSIRYGQQLDQFLIDHWPRSVYKNNYRENHRLALHQTYRCCSMLCLQWQAENLFNELLLHYISHTNCEQWDINLYGESLPRFIEAQKLSNKADALPWDLLADIARLEFALASCYYGKIRIDDCFTIELLELHDIDGDTYAKLMSTIQKQHHYAVFDPQLTTASTRRPPCYQFLLSIKKATPTAVPRLHLSADNALHVYAHNRNFLASPESQSLSTTKHAGSV